MRHSGKPKITTFKGKKAFLFFFALLFYAPVHAYDYQLTVGSLFRNEAAYLREWIEYHKMVGVEHFFLYNNNSTDNWEEVLLPYIQEGLVEVCDYSQTEVLGSHVFKQLDAFRDALNKAKGVAKWVALIDIDEFMLPMKEATVTECLDRHFAMASGVYVSWRMFGTGGITLKSGEPILFKLLSCSLRVHSSNAIGKSIVRPEAVDIDKIWYVHHFPMKPGQKYYNSDAEFLAEGANDLSVPNTHDKYLRINHYYLRDENYYNNVRKHRWEYRGQEAKERLESHYLEFSLVKDYAITRFIRLKHPEEYEKIWKEGDL